MLITYPNIPLYVMNLLAFEAADHIRIEIDGQRIRFVAYLRDIRIPTLLNVEDIVESDLESVGHSITIEASDAREMPYGC